MTTLIGHKQPKNSTRPISLEQFLFKYSNCEDGYKYEWNNGKIEKTKAMNQQQANFFFLLLEKFLQTDAYKNGGGLISEIDMFTSNEQLRRPDIAFYTGEQRKLMKKGENQITSWAIEVISPTDTSLRISLKLVEYFNAGVKVVWHIHPEIQQVHIYTSVEKVQICMGKTMCNAVPAIMDFQIMAEELFN
jgi:Uma2 family endonuclease